MLSNEETTHNTIVLFPIKLRGDTKELVLPHTKHNTHHTGPIPHQITPGGGDTKDPGEEVGSTLVHCWEVGGPALGRLLSWSVEETTRI